MAKKELPVSISKYFKMTKMERRHELQMTLWKTPLLYILGAFILVGLTLLIDVRFELAEHTPQYFQAEFETTRQLISALIGGILTLSAFTLNSLLVVLTTFSGQFSPRLLQNFVKDKQTQHVLGIFNGSFVYVLIMFLFISSRPVEFFVAVPFATALVAFITAITFVYFINHATAWMQVHNLTRNMKAVSEHMIHGELKNELQEFRVSNPDPSYKANKANAYVINAPVSGYVQLIFFKKLIELAKEDHVVMQLTERVGSFVVEGNPLFTIWGPGIENVDANNYVQLIRIGHKETEIQDIRFGLGKLAEIAVKAMGSDDPKTTSNAIHQMTDLMLTMDKSITFSTYLADDEARVRLILADDSFEFYLYQGYGTVRHYAQKNYPIITEIIASLEKLARSVNKEHHKVIWNFGRNTIDHIYTEFIFDLDRKILMDRLYCLADVADHHDEYLKMKNTLEKQPQ